jgi:predicted anti-sigma-YlaC factor YlaD
MNRVPEQSKECEAMRDDLIEFALGTLSGRSRALVLDHLETCAHCTTESEALAEAADALLWLAPEAEPPLGFETRVIERFRGAGAERQIDRRRRLSLFALAALLVAVMGVGIGAVATQGGGARPSATQRPTTGRLVSDGHVLGEVTISAGSPSWMIMDVDTGKISGVVWCEVTFANGRSQTVGKFTISHGYGSWVAPIKASGSDVRSARIVNGEGTVLAQATLAT